MYPIKRSKSRLAFSLLRLKIQDCSALTFGNDRRLNQIYYNKFKALKLRASQYLACSALGIKEILFP
jgi:hypothetical protein